MLCRNALKPKHTVSIEKNRAPTEMKLTTLIIFICIIHIMF